MRYRPDNWDSEKIAKENLPLFKWGTQEYAQVIRGIDIGADAMLEGLCIPENYRKAGWSEETIDTEISGWLVFIPEEVKEDDSDKG